MTTTAVLRPVLSAATIVAIENRMLVSAGAAIAGAAAAAALRPNMARFIPYVGWALTIGTVLYASYEAYNAREVDWAKLEGGTYTADDMAVFMRGFKEAEQVFLANEAGRLASRLREKYILIPAAVMPMIAVVDWRGIAAFGANLRWDPANAPARRRAAMSGRPPAGQIWNGSTMVRGSWEEYPFASTEAARPGALVDRVPLRENWIQGGFIRAASMLQFFQPGDPVTCHVF